MADTSIHVTSEAGDDGWFTYRVTIHWNAFFTNFYDVTAVHTNLAGIIDYNVPTGVASDNLPTQFDVHWANMWPSGQSQTHAFQSESPYVAQKTMMVLFLADPQAILGSPWTVSNIAGYWFAPVLVPTDDGLLATTSTTLRASHVMIEDPDLVHLDRYSVTAEWPHYATLRLESTHDFRSWHPVATYLHYPPHTTWTSAVPLSDYGISVRVSLLANQHMPELVAENEATGVSDSEKGEQVEMTGISPTAQGGVVVTAQTEPGHTYTVTLHGGSRHQILATRTVEASETQTSVIFDEHPGYGVVWVDASRLP